MADQAATSCPTAQASRRSLSGWIFWSIAALFYAYEFLHRVLPSIITNELRASFLINEHQLGMLGAMYFYAYAAFQLPAGILVDKYGAKRLLVIASGVLTLGSFIFSTTTSIEIAQVSRFMIGAGSAFAFVGCLKIGAKWLSFSSFPLIVGLTNLWGTLGALIGGSPFSYIVQQFGWREALIQLSLFGLGITFLLWAFLPDKKNPPCTTQTLPGLFAGLKIVTKNPQSWLIALYAALLVAPIVALPEMWGVEFLKVAYQIPGPVAASFTHTIFIGTAIGGPLLGYLATFVRNKVKFMLITTLGALVLLSLFIYNLHLPNTLLYLTLVSYGLLTANMLLCFTFVTELNPKWAQGAAIGFTNMIIMGVGGLAQHGIGWFLTFSQGPSLIVEDYQRALSLLPLCLSIALLITLFIRHKRKEGSYAF